MRIHPDHQHAWLCHNAAIFSRDGSAAAPVFVSVLETMGAGNRTAVLSQLRNETVRPRDQEGVQGWLHCDSVVVFDCAMVTLTAATHVTAAAF